MLCARAELTSTLAESSSLAAVRRNIVCIVGRGGLSPSVLLSVSFGGLVMTWKDSQMARASPKIFVVLASSDGTLVSRDTLAILAAWSVSGPQVEQERLLLAGRQHSDRGPCYHNSAPGLAVGL